MGTTTPAFRFGAAQIDAEQRQLLIEGQPARLGARAFDVLLALVERRDYLNRKRYSALKYRGPGTELTLGLPTGHIWVSGQSTSRQGIPFAPNLPTEEVFTIAHRSRVDGTVRATKPLSYGGTLIEDFSFTFEAGRIVDLRAARGEQVLRGDHRERR